MNGLGKIFFCLLVACLIVLGVLAFCRHPAHAQAGGGAFKTCEAAWTSREVFMHQGVQYTPLIETYGAATVCLDLNGSIYVLAYSGSPTSPALVHMDALPVVW
jgi:hypothetical protein